MLTISRKYISTFLLLSLVFLLHACAHTIQLNSIEMPSKIDSRAMGKSHVAIMPATGKSISHANYSKFLKGYKGYMAYTDGDSHIIPTTAVEDILMDNPELFASYNKLLHNLKDFDELLTASKTSKKLIINNKPWDGSTGIKYDHILSIHETPGNKEISADKLRIHWTINLKDDIDEGTVIVAAANDLSKQLNCDYLLVPVIVDQYFYKKDVLTVFFFPFWYVYHLHHSVDVAMYLIDGKSGQIVKASLAKNISPVLTAGILNKILDRGDFVGDISFKE